MKDPYNLQRFIDVQDDDFDAAVDEIRSGTKHGHWMWFVFPQLAGLGRSPTARYFAISSLDEARSYLAHPLLGERLRICVSALLQWSGQRSAVQIFGPLDALKLQSSLSLFDLAEPTGLFGRALDAFFKGQRDDATLRLLTGD